MALTGATNKVADALSRIRSSTSPTKPNKDDDLDQEPGQIYQCLIRLEISLQSWKERSKYKNSIFNSRGPFHDSIIKERKEKQVEAEQSEHTACNAMQENKHTGS